MALLKPLNLCIICGRRFRESEDVQHDKLCFILPEIYRIFMKSLSLDLLTWRDILDFHVDRNEIPFCQLCRNTVTELYLCRTKDEVNKIVGGISSHIILNPSKENQSTRGVIGPHQKKRLKAYNRIGDLRRTIYNRCSPYVTITRLPSSFAPPRSENSVDSQEQQQEGYSEFQPDSNEPSTVTPCPHSQTDVDFQEQQDHSEIQPNSSEPDAVIPHSQNDVDSQEQQQEDYSEFQRDSSEPSTVTPSPHSQNTVNSQEQQEDHSDFQLDSSEPSTVTPSPHSQNDVDSEEQHVSEFQPNSSEPLVDQGIEACTQSNAIVQKEVIIVKKPITRVGCNVICCGLCGNKFELASSLDYHERVEACKKPKWRVTAEGSLWYDEKYRVIVHDKRSKRRACLVCGICGQNRIDTKKMEVHIEEDHARPKDYKCTSCTLIFTNTEELKTHSKTHEKPTVCCEHCKIPFESASLLFMHMRKCHPQKVFVKVTNGSNGTKVLTTIPKTL